MLNEMGLLKVKVSQSKKKKKDKCLNFKNSHANYPA